MIIDNINNCQIYQGLHKDFSKIFEVLKTLPIDSMTEKLVFDVGNSWIYPPTVLNEITGIKQLEAHKEFIDIHYILSGTEKFGYANISNLKTAKSYDAEADYELLDGETEFFTLKTGDFCIVYPQDAHIPAFQKIGDENLVRVVAKIRL